MKRLLCDSMLGRLARWLRLLGWDAPLLTRPPLRPAPEEVLLTRRRRLAGRPGVLLVEGDKVAEQLAQVVGELGLEVRPRRIFTRCLDCNRPVEPVDREEVMGLVPDHTLHTAPSFTRCPACGRVFWPGSHGQRARRLLAEMLGGAGLDAG